jgi:hypothetical protein
VVLRGIAKGRGRLLLVLQQPPPVERHAWAYGLGGKERISAKCSDVLLQQDDIAMKS